MPKQIWPTLIILLDDAKMNMKQVQKLSHMTNIQIIICHPLY